MRLNQAAGTDGGFGDGFYVKADGTYMGTTAHYPNCNLDAAQIKVTDTVDEAYDKAKAHGAIAATTREGKNRRPQGFYKGPRRQRG